MSTGCCWLVSKAATEVASSTDFGKVKAQDLKSSRCLSSGKVSSSSMRQTVVAWVSGSNTSSSTVPLNSRQRSGWQLILKLSLRKKCSIAYIITHNYNEMLANRRRGFCSFVSKQRSQPQDSITSTYPELSDFTTLKKQVKRIEIMTRVQGRQKTASMPQGGRQRPNSTKAQPNGGSAPTDFKAVGKQYLQEKKLTATALESGKQQQQTESGLLGEWARYQSFTKQQLIEKLISLEHLANTIFKRNKYLEEELGKTLAS